MCIENKKCHRICFFVAVVCPDWLVKCVSGWRCLGEFGKADSGAGSYFINRVIPEL